MSEREFLDLLNLYLDREITPVDADRLEQEIRSNALRHRTYLQYCRMQRAVRLLGSAEAIRGEHQSPGASASEPGLIREGWRARWIWTGAVAAAAILLAAFAVRRVEALRTTAEDRLAAGTVQKDAVASSLAPTLGLSGDALLLSAFPASGSAPKVHEDQFNWIRQFQLVSLESRLGAQSLLPDVAAPLPAATHHPAGAETTEMAAFKFVK